MSIRDKNGGVIGTVQRGDMSPTEVTEERHYWPRLTIPSPRGSPFSLVSKIHVTHCLYIIKTSMTMLLDYLLIGIIIFVTSFERSNTDLFSCKSTTDIHVSFFKAKVQGYQRVILHFLLFNLVKVIVPEYYIFGH